MSKQLMILNSYEYLEGIGSVELEFRDQISFELPHNRIFLVSSFLTI